MAMGGFDCAVLMRDTAIVARRWHPVIGAQRVITSGHVLVRILSRIPERGREAVAALPER